MIGAARGIFPRGKAAIGAERGIFPRRRELDLIGAKRASDGATAAAKVTKVLSGLEMALSQQDEETGAELAGPDWAAALEKAIQAAEALSWEPMPEVRRTR